MEKGEETISLISSDGIKSQVNKKSTRLSGLLTTLCEEYPDENELKIHEVKGSILNEIVEFLNHYSDSNPKEVPKPLPQYNIEECFGTWEDKFV
jgi:hypothetical protein